MYNAFMLRMATQTFTLDFQYAVLLWKLQFPDSSHKFLTQILIKIFLYIMASLTMHYYRKFREMKDYCDNKLLIQEWTLSLLLLSAILETMW